MALVVGIDEVGRGPLAGPLIACACIINEDDAKIDDVMDSKKLSKTKRAAIALLLQEKYEFGIGSSSVEEIDELNILNATKLAIIRAEAALKQRTQIVLVDGDMKFEDERFCSIVKGDEKIYAISCASIIAKEYRDKLMQNLSEEYPRYDWANNAGYGTKAHIDALRLYGPTPHHRRLFIRKICDI
ncbi:MAG: ribonuclease HII [Rickettsiaceae bacterium]|nr:ribonuclease HII [Rickettsiaceae bacterium]